VAYIPIARGPWTRLFQSLTRSFGARSALRRDCRRDRRRRRASRILGRACQGMPYRDWHYDGDRLVLICNSRVRVITSFNVHYHGTVCKLCLFLRILGFCCLAGGKAHGVYSMFRRLDRILSLARLYTKDMTRRVCRASVGKISFLFQGAHSQLLPLQTGSRPKCTSVPLSGEQCRFGELARSFNGWSPCG